MRELLQQFPTPLILLGDFNAHNPSEEEKYTTRVMMIEKTIV